jgi:hypothetical protein
MNQNNRRLNVVLIIKKRDVTETRAAAPLVADASASPAAPSQQTDETDVRRLKRWQTKHPSVHATAKVCAFCMHSYIMPCVKGQVAAVCQNYVDMLQRGKDRR